MIIQGGADTTMICKEIIKIIENAYSRAYALEWDNVGLLAGRDDKEVQRIYVALDATDEVIDAASAYHANMLITHHPLIFSGLKRINNQDFIGRRIIKLIQNDISYYAMHTNYDVKGMAALSGEKMQFKEAEVLEVTAEDPETNLLEGIGRITELTSPITLQVCCQKVKEAFQLNEVKVFGELGQKVQRIAICPGSGKSVIPEALKRNADVLITGDIGHHEGIDANAQGLAVIDAGHYGIEHIFIEDMKQYLEKNLEGVEVIAAPVRHPFQMV